jgi:integrase
MSTATAAPRRTVADLRQMRPGDKANDGNVPRMFWYRGKDVVTAYVRLPGGKDQRIGALDVNDLTRDAMRDVIRQAAAVRDVGRQNTKATPAPVPGHAATLGEVWASLIRAIEAGGVGDGRKWNERGMRQNTQRITRHIEPTALWNTPVASITPPMVAELLLPIRAATPNEERKVRDLLKTSFDHAVGLRLVEANPVLLARDAMRASVRPVRPKRLPAYTTWPELRKLLADIEQYNGDAAVRNALKLQAYTAQRTSEICQALWSEFDLPEKGRGRWVIGRDRMKIKDKDFDQELVLPAPVVQFLRKLPRRSEYVFATTRSAHVKSLDAAMRDELGRAGKHCPHGWRSALKTLANAAVGKDDRPLFAPRWIDAVCDHSPKGIDGHYVRSAAVEGGGRVLAWWYEQLTAEA